VFHIFQIFAVVIRSGPVLMRLAFFIPKDHRIATAQAGRLAGTNGSAVESNCFTAEASPGGTPICFRMMLAA